MVFHSRIMRPSRSHLENAGCFCTGTWQVVASQDLRTSNLSVVYSSSNYVVATLHSACEFRTNAFIVRLRRLSIINANAKLGHCGEAFSVSALTARVLEGLEVALSLLLKSLRRESHRT